MTESSAPEAKPELTEQIYQEKNTESGGGQSFNSQPSHSFTSSSMISNSRWWFHSTGGKQLQAVGPTKQEDQPSEEKSVRAE